MSKCGEVVQEGGDGICIHVYIYIYVHTYIYSTPSDPAPFQKNSEIQCF